MDNVEVAKNLYIRFSTIYGDGFVKDFHTEKFREIWYQDWADGLRGLRHEAIRQAIDHCKLNSVWAPNLAEFRKICEKFSGLPSIEETIQKAIRRDFEHPIIRLVFDRVGSWAFGHDSEKDLKFKVMSAYQDALNELRGNSSLMLNGSQVRLENSPKTQ